MGLQGLVDKLTGTRRPQNGAQPAPPERVTAALLGVNRPDVPYAIREGTPAEGVDLVGEWRLTETEWRALFSNGGVTKTYKILMRLDPKRAEVRSIDEEWSVSWNNGIPDLSRSKAQAKGQLDENVHAFQYGFDEHGHWGKLYDYSYRTKDLKEPLREAATGSGWVWRALAFRDP
jgi:hypothetical protein